MKKLWDKLVREAYCRARTGMIPYAAFRLFTEFPLAWLSGSDVKSVWSAEWAVSYIGWYCLRQRDYFGNFIDLVCFWKNWCDNSFSLACCKWSKLFSGLPYCKLLRNALYSPLSPNLVSPHNIRGHNGGLLWSAGGAPQCLSRWHKKGVSCILFISTRGYPHEWQDIIFHNLVPGDCVLP